MSDLRDVILDICSQSDKDLLAKTSDEFAAEWRYEWDNGDDAAWNLYRFMRAAELMARRARRWEEHHGGRCCVVERVRDKYIMPRIAQFLAAVEAAK